MKTWLAGLSATLLGITLIAGDADAARIGGGRSLGAQRGATSTPPASAPARQSQQVQQAAPSQQPAAAPGARGSENSSTTLRVAAGKVAPVGG